MDILEQIGWMAEKFGERTAIKSSQESLTYAELERYSDGLAAWIHRRYGDSKIPVIVYGHKSPWMIVCFLACVKAGKAYCPQDISIPKVRVFDTVRSVEPELVFVVEGELEPQIGKCLGLKEIKKIAENTEEKSCKEWWVKGDDTYYIIFTSGSTGKPKGVQITADCLNHYLDWSVTLGGSREEKEGAHFLNQAPFSFDLSVMDLYTSLASGGTLFPMEKELQSDYGRMFAFLEQADINFWVSTPSFVDMCLSDRKFNQALLPKLQAFLFCGEVLTTSTVWNLMERFPDAKIINTYGPTESTVAVSDVEITKKLLQDISAAGGTLPVGCEKKNTFLEIWDEDGKPLPDGKQGEIIIIGDTVSTGYYGRPELTEKAFFTCERKGQNYRAYRTGDAGYKKDGQLYYNGRIDLQVKLHGYRIEIEDIENNMVRLPQIRQAVVVPNIREGKVKSLTAFVTGDMGSQTPLEFSQKVKQDLKELIPTYMIPKKIRHIDSIPMNPHGKADRKYLGGLVG